MTQKEITINGKQYPVVFDLQTMMNFEEITNGTSFFGAPLDTLKHRVAIIAAAAISADDKTDLTVEAILGDKDYKAMQQIIAAYNIVMTLAGEFFPIPEIEKKNNPEPPAEEQSDDEKPKN